MVEHGYGPRVRAVTGVTDLRFSQRLTSVIGEVERPLVHAVSSIALEGLAQHAAQGRTPLVVLAPFRVEFRLCRVMVVKHKPRAGVKGDAEVLQEFLPLRFTGWGK